MPAARLPPHRDWHLEGLRGVACIAVLLLHGFGDFLPGLVMPQGNGLLEALRRSPLRLLYDGDSAVFLFFTLSGYVLTPSFLRGAGHPVRLMAARLLRFLPGVVLGSLAGWLLLRLSGTAHLIAADKLGGGWMLGGWETPPTLAALMRDAGLNALLLGYRDLSLLDPLLHDSLWPSGDAFDPPLWTLSVELQGSLLIALLAMARRRGHGVWLAAVTLAAIVLLRSPFLCFVIGHIASVARDRTLPVPKPLLLAAGLALCLDAGAEGSPWLTALAIAPLPLLPALAPDLMQRGLGATLVFIALHRSAGGMLATAPALWLGRMSFPLYLIHWPMLHGPGAALAVALMPIMPAPAAGLAGLAAAFAMSVLAAGPLARLDQAALRLARQLRAPLPADGYFARTSRPMIRS